MTVPGRDCGPLERVRVREHAHTYRTGAVARVLLGGRHSGMA